ncbi:peptidylprolyl isomerase [Thiosulfativibrio zosterae]|uniref:Peptidyl-prolyl cis-trans isomerase n=1 Tax=Thiosulfativibrio zosterae TaxID=2675053 RepID=A0A6F8PNX8_9GAMM|nr:peptidylprolyl isomerase [Thiosulfativibrio zosterae]BBP43823.1 peptidyl-prolyl cis-trans isomerase [Thiosulfativibrio zosterae]
MTQVVFTTSMGDITIEVDHENAPIGAENFVHYAMEGFYNGTIFHRIIQGFMVQGGGMLPGLEDKESGDPIENEGDNGLKNVRGSLSYARTMDPHSATTQFFMNLVDNDFLDHRSKTTQGWGYAVFGKIVEGLEVIDEMAKVKTTSRRGHQDVPVDDILIISTKVIEA